MSSLSVDTITAKTSNTDLVLDGAGTGVVNLASGAKLNGVAFGAGATATAVGKVLQVVQGTYAGASENTTSTTFSDTSLTVNITPTATTSKFLVTCAANIGGYRASDTNAYAGAIRFRESAVTSDVFPSTTYGFSFSLMDASNTADHYLDLGGVAASWLHSPTLSDLSTLTYVLQFKAVVGQARHNFAGTNSTSIITVLEIGA